MKRMLGVRDTTTPSWCVMRECGLESLQCNCQWCAQLYNSLTKSNSYTMKKVLHADMQLSTRSKDCWSAHFLSAMDGLTQSYMFKQKLQHCDPIDFSRFVVDLSERHLEYWTPYSETHPREHNSKRSTNQQWCALLTKKALVTHLPYILPKYMFDYLPRDVIRSTARFTPVFTPYVLRQRHGVKVISQPVTCVMLMISKMSSMSIFTAPIPT